MEFNKIKVEEIFTSIQGEGPYIGVKQVFVRLCGCNLSCSYCDTETDSASAKFYNIDELAAIINTEKNVHSVSFTGGEPLLHSDILRELFPKILKPIYLETNGTLADNLETVIKDVDFISADVKLKSASGMSLMSEHSEFLDVCKSYGKEVFIKVVFDENISDEEIFEVAMLAERFNILLVLQPMMKNDKLVPSSLFMQKVFDKFVDKYANVRLIPQTHKFLNLM